MRDDGAVGVNEDCRHYILQTTRLGERLERCRLSVNETLPFACPDGCVFFEPRRTSTAGWQVERRDDEGR